MNRREIVTRQLVRYRRIFSWRKLVIGTVAILAVMVVTAATTYAHFARDIADRGRLMNRESTGIIIRDRNGEVLYSHGQLPTQPDLKLNQISDHLEQAVLASEDQEFYKHQGYSPRGIVRALYANFQDKDPTRYGGSTITQQLVKNKLLGTDKTYYRKYQEIIMAVAVERRYSKQEIMEMYLNSVYFGEGAFGINSAAKIYFNKTAQDLTPAESAMLVGLLPAPSASSPISGSAEIAKNQQHRVLTQMVDAGYIKFQDIEKIASQNLTYAKTSKSDYTHAQHFVMMVLDDLKQAYGEENVTRAGYDITTTLDLGWQKQAESQMSETINKIKHLGASNGSLVAIDPKTGAIRALVGSVDWNNPEFGKVNMATSPRQPGSSFKPIYYTEALNKKIITAATVLKDEARTYGPWNPSNYDFRYRGNITVRNALAQSLNMPAIEVMEKLGPEEASRVAQRMQISTVNEPQKYGLTLALGTAEVKVLDMTNAYAALANQGKQYDAEKVSIIKNKYGQQVYKSNKQPRQVTTPEASFLMSSILSDNQARAATFGRSLNIDGRTVAVKTGTTNDSKDAWTIGYTPSVSVGVWVGNNKNQPMTGLIGSTSAGAIWKNTMRSMLDKQAAENFSPTPSIVHFAVCGIPGFTSKRSDAALKEYFIKGTEPRDSCKPPEPKEEKKDSEEKRREEEKEPEKKPQQNTEQNEGNPIGGGTGSGEIPIDEPVTDPPAEETPPSDGTTTDPATTSGT